MSETVKPVERPHAVLAGIGGDTFAAFNAMQATKQRHYTLLARLDGKRTRYGLTPSAREAALLEALLADHDAQVTRFTQAAAELKRCDREAHLALFGYIGVLTREEGEGQAAVRH